MGTKLVRGLFTPIDACSFRDGATEPSHSQRRSPLKREVDPEQVLTRERLCRRAPPTPGRRLSTRSEPASNGGTNAPDHRSPTGGFRW
jgi:hypothetical protein